MPVTNPPGSNGGGGGSELESLVLITQRFKTGRYYSNGAGSGLLSTSLGGEGDLRVCAFTCGEDRTFDRIGLECTTLGTAGALVRLAIYADDGDCSPGALVLDAGTVDVTSTGAKEIVINQALTRDIYWLGGAWQGGAATRGTVRVIGSGTTSVLPTIQPGSAALPTTVSTGIQDDGIPGALPANFACDAFGNIAVPRILLRAA